MDTTNNCINLNTPSDVACKEYDALVTQLCGWYEDKTIGGLEATRLRMIKADPGFVLGRALDLELDHMGALASISTSELMNEKFKQLEELAREKASSLSEQERLHVEVVKCWTRGELRAVATNLEKICTLYPEDVMALKMNQDINFYIGTALPMRNALAANLAKMSTKNPLKGYAHGMLAFAFEESNMYELGEREALKALDLIPVDTWAIHNYAHCLEMQGKVEQGLKWMYEKKPDWSQCSTLAGHQYWHSALFHINNNQFDEAIALLDEQVLTRCAPKSAMEIHNSASMLYRMELVDLFSRSTNNKTLKGNNNCERWKCVYESSKPHKDDHLSGFNDAHYMMSFLAMDDMKCAREFIDSLESSSYKSHLKPTVRALLEAMYQFKLANYAQCVELLEPIRFEIINIGGSHAQRDVFEQLLLVAALKSDKSEHNKLGQRMIQEREAFHGRTTIQTELLAAPVAA